MPNCRALPAPRHLGRITVVFCDGNAKPMQLSRVDDFNGDGVPDNGFWNGAADPARR